MADEMAGLKVDKRLFPLTSKNDFVNLFYEHIVNKTEPDLTTLSIIIGYLEHALTTGKTKDKLSPTHFNFPHLKFSTVQALYHKFVTFVKSSIDLTIFEEPGVTTEFVKKVSDIVWSGLSRGNYQDKAHLQTIFTFLTENKLDSLGVSLAVVAACQVLNYNTVHLAVSEDHSWVYFGEQTAEVTWHGKGVEDRRGQTIDLGVAENNWLYLGGQAVLCDRYMEVVTMVTSINPAIAHGASSEELQEVKFMLLEMFYQRGLLDKYPIALSMLADLRVQHPGSAIPDPSALYLKGIHISESLYKDRLVLPYTKYGKFLFNEGSYKEALKQWVHAARVISQYNYNREDEEIYKEFMDITQDKLPAVTKWAQEGVLHGSVHRRLVQTKDGNHNQQGNSTEVPFLEDPENYRLLLELYDGLCQWEEGSVMPVLHITWAKFFIACMSRFSCEARLVLAEKEDTSSENESGSENESSSENDQSSDERTVELDNGREEIEKNDASKDDTVEELDVSKSSIDLNDSQISFGLSSVDEEKIKSAIAQLESQVGCDKDDDNDSQHSDMHMADLAKACGDSILNPDFLLGRGEPFSKPVSPSLEKQAKSKDSILKITNADTSKSANCEAEPKAIDEDIHSITYLPLEVKSAKMKDLKRLLTSKKINASAITLQLTAQSQVSVKNSLFSPDHLPRKRLRRT